eukprot:4069978-Amphidinium_carterae.1
MAVPAFSLRDALAAAFGDVGVGQSLAEAFTEAFGGIESTMEDLDYATPADIEGVLGLLKEPTQAEGGEDVNVEDGPELRPLTKARIRRAVQSCKTAWQQRQQPEA